MLYLVFTVTPIFTVSFNRKEKVVIKAFGELGEKVNKFVCDLYAEKKIVSLNHACLEIKEVLYLRSKTSFSAIFRTQSNIYDGAFCENS